MNDYLILVSESDEASTADQRALLEAREQFTAKLKAKGALVDSERLRASGEGRRVTTVDGKVTVANGPFEGTLSSYYSVRAGDLDAAVALAKELPLGPGEAVEVRPVMKGKLDPHKTDKTGKVFAFAVLGSAPNEEAWIRVMNKIDDETQETFPEGRLGGVRLEAPRTGRRLLNQHGKTVLLDGPFLESKEVIGGLFFIRMASLDDAVEWVKSTAFVRIGGAEVREVWRS